MMHSSTAAGSMPARATASLTTSAPSCGALKSFRPPRNLPVGVRTALTMTVSRMRVLDDGDPANDVAADEARHPFFEQGSGALDFLRPRGAARADRERAVGERRRRRAVEGRPGRD